MMAFAFPEADVAAITAPRLVVPGDADVVRPEHAVALFHLLGGGVPGGLVSLPSQLATLPGTTHGTIVLEPIDPLLAVIEPCLTAPMPDAGRGEQAKRRGTEHDTMGTDARQRRD